MRRDYQYREAGSIGGDPAAASGWRGRPAGPRGRPTAVGRLGLSARGRAGRAQSGGPSRCGGAGPGGGGD